jgi:hypothetical protein
MKSWVCRVIGLALIIGAGVLYMEPFTPLLAPTTVPNFTESTAPPLTGRSDPRLSRIAGETDLAFAARINDEISRAFAHCTPEDSIRQSWLLHVLRQLGFSAVTEHGLLTSHGNLCGFCHQAAHIEATALRRAGAEAEVFGLNGHVVVRMQDGADAYFIDPDFGVGPFRAADPDLERHLSAAYSEVVGPAAAAPIVSYYSTSDDNDAYSSSPYLEEIEMRQGVLIVVQDALLFLIFAAGVASIVAGFQPSDERGRAAGVPGKALPRTRLG